MTLEAHRSVVCGDGRHHACRPEEWSCTCPCHLGAAEVANSSPDVDADPASPAPSDVARTEPATGEEFGASPDQETGTVTDLFGEVRDHTQPAALRPTGSTL